jgi:hypothetical protein
MPDLPIRRIVMYKHGVGYFERRGPVSGTSLRLSFPREAMDDILKSLVAIDMGAGQVRGVDYETPEDRATRLARGSIHLSDTQSLLDLLRDLRGRRVQLEAQGEPLEGTVIGVDLDMDRPLHTPLVTLALADGRTIRSVAVRSITSLSILDDRAAEDLTYFLRASQSEEDRRAATLRLSEGDHDMLVGYVAPAPAWRVSYRLLAEPRIEDQAPAPTGTAADLSAQSSVLLQGWGLFDNQLDEDLEDVTLTLVAGMPVSFRYRLYEPHTPERPLVQDEERTVAAPVEFAGMPAAPPPAMMAAPAPTRLRALGRKAAMDDYGAAAESAPFSLGDAEQSTVAAATGEDRGALFQYQVAYPVSVARGQSAMVPIVGQRLGGRKELLYNGRKLPKHPVASLRLKNETGLTLERGPVTVIDEGDYAGEAVLPFTRPGAELIVAYAVELGVSIVEQPRSWRVMKGLRIHNSYVLVEEWDVQSVTYLIQNTLVRPADLTIEQAEWSGYELFETAATTERAQGLARWKVTCAPGVETRHVVQYRQLTRRHEQVRSFSVRQLREYLQQKFLDDATFRGLEAVLAIYDEIAQKQQRQQQIEQERNQIYKRQQQTQGSLGPLGRDGEEGKLRGRYVQQLNDLENQLNALTAEEKRLSGEIERLEQQAASKIAALAK